ncbi:MAG: tRNA 2-thiocytidine biosynthesis protein TtcA [Paraglaciecola sp.]|jgi:tRNA 2-thiocytidine biosynthesis protein TtcA
MTQSIKPDIASHFKKLQKRLRSKTGRAIADFNMIEAGDKIMVCLSGGKDSYALLDMLLHLRVEYKIIEKYTYKTTGSLCSRLRRGIVYTQVSKLGISKIALGHHRDDMPETLFLNMFHTGRLKSMPLKLTSDEGRHIVIRPLVYCAEQDLADYALADPNAFNFIDLATQSADYAGGDQAFAPFDLKASGMDQIVTELVTITKKKTGMYR